MGLVRAAGAAVSTLMGDQWREYFYCSSLDNDTRIVKGEKRISERSSHTKGAENCGTGCYRGGLCGTR